MTTAFALAASVLWGLADFGGGFLTRRLPALTVLVASQAAAAICLAAAIAATGGWHASGVHLGYAVAAGAIGPVAMLAFYRALALGPMGVVSPLATVGVVVPVGVGLAIGERPGLLQAAGIAVAAVGVVLAGGPKLGGAHVERRTIALALLAAFGFGAVMALIAQAGPADALLPILFVQRCCNLAVGGAALAVAARRSPKEYRLHRVGGGTLLGLGAVGVADVAANGVYVLATHAGPVAVAAVLASLYPVVTALAARAALAERLRPVQATGAALALLGTVLLAAG
jgi:drug/metabolite transporter (DMT)-like permease